MVKGNNCHSETSDALAAPWAPAVLADKGLFLLLLYDKAISCMDEALQLMEEGDMVGKGERLVRAQDIVLELSDALDKRAGDVAANLERLYLYIYRRLIRGNVRLDRGAILEAKALMEKLLSGWQTAILGCDSTTVPRGPVSRMATEFRRLRA